MFNNFTVNNYSYTEPPLSQTGRPKRSRTVFTPSQISFLEERFAENNYVTPNQCREMANALALPEQVVRRWFQNRRARKKKEATGLSNSYTLHWKITLIGPLPETLGDFRRMTLKQNSRVIVMMTKEKERNSARESTDYAYYTNRTFNLQKMISLSNSNKTNSQNFNGGYNSEGESLNPMQKPRQIKQSQFTAWPDCRSPEQPQPLLLFIRQVCQAR
nr:hypothetical transcript [Hymenolepis microstoma]